MNAPADLPSAALDPIVMLRCRSAPPAHELRRLDVWIEREVLRLRARYQLSLDELRGLYISDERVDAWLADARRGSEPETLSAAVDARAHRSNASRDDDRAAITGWQSLCTRLRLTRAEADVLLIALAPELDPRYGPLLAYLNDDASQRWATPELVARLAGVDASGQRQRRVAASPGGRLFELGLLEWQPGSQDAPTRAQRGLRVAPPLADWLAGQPYADERLAPIVWSFPCTDAAPLALGADDTTRIERLAQSLRDGEPWPLVGIAASDAAEAMAVAREIFRRASRPTLLLPTHAPRDGLEGIALLRAVRLASTVFGFGVIVMPAPREVEPGAALIDLCVHASAVVVIDTERRDMARRLTAGSGRELLALPLTPLGRPQRVDAWAAALSDSDPHDIDLMRLADRFAIGPVRIRESVAAARRQASLDDACVDTRRLLDAARALCTGAGSDVTRSIPSQFEWRDLILPPPVQERLDDIVRAVELRGRVLEEWGFGRSLGGQRGLKVMFAGASGTGKSMAAGLVAKTLALDLHRVELAGVVSKYIGETEKNLDRAFDAARSANAILFVDEADALFGKRSEVKDAHDRYANVETAYLLQKMEDHDGVVILATNLANNIDTAFSRRMHFVVEFPLPDIPRRDRLWRGMFPPGAPLGDDVDFAFLARQFAFAGGDIRNIVLDAAYAAARHDEPISMAHVVQSVARQYAKRGKVAGPAEFREYHGLLGASSTRDPNAVEEARNG